MVAFLGLKWLRVRLRKEEKLNLKIGALESNSVLLGVH